jgi:hypothetical protein
LHRRWTEPGIDVLLNRRSVEPGVLPQPVRNRHGVDTGGRPPRRLVATLVERPMMSAAQRHRELIADPAAQGPWLHESEVMGVARLPPAEQAWLGRHELQVGAIAVAARFAQREVALVDMANNGCEWRTGIICLVSALIEMLRGDVRFSPVLSVSGPSGAPRATRR